MTDPDGDLPYFTHDIEAAWIAEHSDVPLDVVDTVLSIEWEYMVASGIAQKPPGAPNWEYRFYPISELVGCEPVIDTDRIARDSERLAGVPYDVAMTVLDFEFRFLELRGLAEA